MGMIQTTPLLNLVANHSFSKPETSLVDRILSCSSSSREREDRTAAEGMEASSSLMAIRIPQRNAKNDRCLGWGVYQLFIYLTVTLLCTLRKYSTMMNTASNSLSCLIPAHDIITVRQMIRCLLHVGITQMYTSMLLIKPSFTVCVRDCYINSGQLVSNKQTQQSTKKRRQYTDDETTNIEKHLDSYAVDTRDNLRAGLRI